MLVIMFVSIFNATAQVVYKIEASEITLSNGQVYRSADIPGVQWLHVGDNLSTKISNYFSGLRVNDYERYVREYNAFSVRGLQPIRIAQINTAGVGMMGGMMMGGGINPMGGMMMGMNGTGGYVYGAGGAASAQSNVQITNENLVGTVGSGLQVGYDKVNGIQVAGDPLMAAFRVASALGGGKKKAARQQAAAAANGSNVRVVYVDSATGQVVAQPTQTRSAQAPAARQAAPARQATQTNSGVSSTAVYGNVYSGF